MPAGILLFVGYKNYTLKIIIPKSSGENKENDKTCAKGVGSGDFRRVEFLSDRGYTKKDERMSQRLRQKGVLQR